jgi:hypothetical protein
MSPEENRSSPQWLAKRIQVGSRGSLTSLIACDETQLLPQWLALSIQVESRDSMMTLLMFEPTAVGE